MNKTLNTVIIDVKVVPGSGRSAFKGEPSGTIKCFIKSPPERGLANYEVVALIAKTLKLTRNQVTILTGHTARLKRIAIRSTLTKEQILSLLHIQPIEKQLPIT